MIIIPAIDILDSKVVRLRQGDYNKSKVYSDSPVDAAKTWAAKGAKLIHIVDLDGAKTGRPKNLDIVRLIASKVKIEIELGGGIRDIETIKTVLDAGVSKAVLGTKAFKDELFASQAISEFKEKVIFGLDARDDEISVGGWTEKAGIGIKDALSRFRSMGLKRIIYTDISKDGMMQGPNIAAIKRILAMAGMEVIASGGVSKIGDITALKDLEKSGLTGVIIGKALYEGAIELEDAINAG